MSLLLFTTALGLCPFSGSSGADLSPGQNTRTAARVAPEGYYEAFDNIDFGAVKTDLTALFTDSQDFWPADYGNYAPFFVRLAWHNSGSYRSSDGRGGPDGGRQRFDPERSWDDNTNLDKARKLLEPIKQKYGIGLSWGDLIILAGDTAIESMGGKVLGTCLGRIDDSDGFWSERLGPTADQEENSPCPVPGACQTPFGSNVIGLIYVNPEGFHADPVPSKSAPQVRSTFERMSMNDTETVALIGGGHAFGKTHGACPTGPGEKPFENPLHPWAGTCGKGAGKGKGVNAFTAGFEGPWTATPTEWNNEYFTNLYNYEWEKHKGPGGHWQWRVTKEKDSPWTTFANGTGRQDVMMLTTDVSLMNDPEGKYESIVKGFAEDQSFLEEQFAAAWYKLTTRDMGPVTRCLGPLTPPAQPFQAPLPEPPAKLADFDSVRLRIIDALTTEQPEVLPMVDGSYGPEFVRLAWRCASTFRASDYQGGCNGARIRMSPQKDWPVNKGLDKVVDLLMNIKLEFGKSLSWSDLIVLAGTVALEEAGAPKMTSNFCGGRTDANVNEPDHVSKKLEYMNREFYVESRMNATVDDLQQYTLLLGLDPTEFTALAGARALGTLPTGSNGKSRQRTMTPTQLGTGYFESLVKENWVVTSDGEAYEGENGLTILRDDILLLAAPEFLAVVQNFAGDQELYLNSLSSAWTKMMNADRFDGPTRNLCDSTSSSFKTKKQRNLEQGSIWSGSQSEANEKTEHLLHLYLVTILALAVSLVLAVGGLFILMLCPKNTGTRELRSLREPLARQYGSMGVSNNL